MFKRLLLTISLMTSATLLNAADFSQKRENILDGVMQLSDYQMKSISGEEITIRIIFPISGKETIEYNDGDSSDWGLIIINGDNGSNESIDIYHKVGNDVYHSDDGVHYDKVY